MKKKTIICVLAFIGLLSCIDANAQNYSSAIGVRAGYPWAVSFKTFVANNGAIELYAGPRGYTNYRWVTANAAYLLHFDIEGVDGLQWYAGAGIGVQFYSYERGYTGVKQGFSLQGYLGLDYKLEGAPLNITLDWVPVLFLNGYEDGFYPRYGNLGVRYVLGE